VLERPEDWSGYNATQTGRAPRELLPTLLAHAGDGDGRLALDLGCGAGVETAELLRRGWRVLAVDWDPTTPDLLAARVPPEATAGLTVLVRGFAELDALPPLDLVHASWSLPYAGRHLPRLWRLLVDALVPGGWLGCVLFGDRASADAPDTARLTDAQVAGLLAGLAVAEHTTQEATGVSFTGDTRWHVHTVVARKPADDGLTSG
jgi:trans-aconitate methyltransferase